ncbi:MAG: hypothetical protein EGQ31_03165 [Prevotella sp.]|nr:hypothetical protein [Prevotella sp.]
MKQLFSLILCFLSFSTFALADEWTTIKNGEVWYDTNGDTIQAHAPGFLRYGDRWYMVGEDRGDSWNPDVNMYSSTDLVNWRFEAKVVKNGVTVPELGKTRFIERAKIMRNPKTGKFIIWCHWEGPRYAASEAACFSADSICGPYKLEWSGRPLGVKSRDCNVFVDNNGKAYFVSTTTENTNIGIFQLSDDYTKVVSHKCVMKDLRREAPVIVNKDGLYYMLSSACTGWAPNQCKLSTSKKLGKGWSQLENIGDDKAFRTQAAAVLEIKGTKQTTYLYVGDRWLERELPASRIIIFPISFKDGKCEFEYCDKFDINFTTGEVRKY